MSPLSWFGRCVKHDRKVPRAFARAMAHVRPGMKYAKQRQRIIKLWQWYLAKRRAT